MENYQKEWDQLFNKHRLSLVTNVREEVVEKLSDLKIIHGTIIYKKFYTVYFKNKTGIYEMTHQIKEKIISIEETDGEVIALMSYGEVFDVLKNEVEVIKAFLNDCQLFAFTTAQELFEKSKEERRRAFERAFIGKKITGVDWDENGEPHFFLEGDCLKKASARKEVFFEEWDEEIILNKKT